MRHIACNNPDCGNRGAPYHDDEPDQVVVLCPVCEKAMPVVNLAELLAANDAAVEARAAEIAKEEAKQEKAANAAVKKAAKTAPPTPLEALAALPPDQPVMASELLAILRPDTMAADAAPAPAAEEPTDA